MASAAKDEHSGISSHFNHKSGFWSFLHWGHLALMAGMVFMMMPVDATAGDLIVQSAHAVGEMFMGLIEHGSDVLGDLFRNAAEGHFAPTTWEAGNMHDTMNHAVSAHVSAAHNAVGASCVLDDGLLRDFQASGDLDLMMEDWARTDQGFCEYVQGEYGHMGH